MQIRTQIAVVSVVLAACFEGAVAQCAPPGIEDFESSTATVTSECGTNDPGVLPSGWSNDPTGSTVWRVFSGPTPSGGTGPQGDHTTGSGNYVYVETSCSTPAFWHGVLNLPCFDASAVLNPTLSFWSHMYGADMGTLSVQQLDATGVWNTIYMITGDQGDQWTINIVPVTLVNGTATLRFFYVRGSSFQSDCCLDDIVFGEPTASGACIGPILENFENETPATPINTCGTAAGGTLPSGWRNDPSNLTDWRVHTGPTPSGGTGPIGGHNIGPTSDPNGIYLYAEVSGCGHTEGTIELPCFYAQGVSAPTLEFWYQLSGADAGTLTLESRLADGTWQPVWSITGDQGPLWAQGAAFLVPVNGLVQTRFHYANGDSYQGDCALDDVRFGEPTPGVWEINGDGAWMDVDGVLGTTLSPVVLARCPTELVELSMRSQLPPAPYDLLLGLTTLVPGDSPAGSATAAGQNINIALSSPFLSWLVGGSTPNLAVPFPGDQIIMVPTPPNIGPISAQMFVLDAAHPDGFQLSQPTQVNVENPTSVPGPLLDEEIVTLTPAALPLCGPPSFPFYGLSYSAINVHSNGRISFGAGPSIDFSASPAEAASGLPFVGLWTDLDPSQGSVNVLCPQTDQVHVHFSAPYLGEPTTVVDFTITLNASTGVIELEGLQAVVPNPLSTPLATAGDRQFMGMSPGLNASDPGPVTFAVGGSGGGAAGGSMLYDWYDHLSGGPALVPSLLSGGVSLLVFTPDGLGGYLWTGH